MKILKARIRVLLHRGNCKLSGIINKGNDIVVYGFDCNIKGWSFWNYTPKKFGLGILTPLELNLTQEDAIFKKNIDI